MATKEDEIHDLSQRISLRQERLTRAKFASEQAMEKHTQAREVLKEEFGVETSEELRDLKDKLEKDLEDEIQKVRAALAEADD